MFLVFDFPRGFLKERRRTRSSIVSVKSVPSRKVVSTENHVLLHNCSLPLFRCGKTFSDSTSSFGANASRKPAGVLLSVSSSSMPATDFANAHRSGWFATAFGWAFARKKRNKATAISTMPAGKNRNRNSPARQQRSGAGKEEALSPGTPGGRQGFNLQQVVRQRSKRRARLIYALRAVAPHPLP